jgi:hypothetical protein
MMRRGAGPDTDHAGRELLEEKQQVAALQLPTDNRFTARVYPMNLENRFGDIETNRRDRLHA